MASKNLKLLREKFGKSQGDMAKLLNISLGSYCNKENGIARFTLDEAHKISSTFNMSIDDIFFKEIVFSVNT